MKKSPFRFVIFEIIADFFFGIIGGSDFFRK